MLLPKTKRSMERVRSEGHHSRPEPHRGFRVRGENAAHGVVGVVGEGVPDDCHHGVTVAMEET